jgi:hypothetical protein
VFLRSRLQMCDKLLLTSTVVFLPYEAQMPYAMAITLVRRAFGLLAGLSLELLTFPAYQRRGRPLAPTNPPALILP